MFGSVLILQILSTNRVKHPRRDGFYAMLCILWLYIYTSYLIGKDLTVYNAVLIEMGDSPISHISKLSTKGRWPG